MNKKYIFERALLITYGLIVCFLLLKFEKVLKGLGVLIGVLLPVILGGAFAFLLNIPMSFLEKKFSKLLNKLNLKERTVFMISRITSLLLIIIILIAIIILSINIIIPQVVQSFYTIVEKLPNTIKEIEKFLSENIKNIPLIEWFNTNMGKFGGSNAKMLNGISQNILGGAINITLGITTSIINSVLGLIISIYILLDKEHLKRQLKLIIHKISKDKHSNVISILKLTYYKLRKYIGGQATDATILFLMVFVSMTIFKMPYALLISSIVGVSAVIPIFGPFIGALISILIMFIGGYDNIVWFILLVIVMQQIEGNIIYPIVVGNSLGLSSLYIVVSVIVFSSLFGILGIILGMPLFGVFYEILSKYIKKT